MLNICKNNILCNIYHTIFFDIAEIQPKAKIFNSVAKEIDYSEIEIIDLNYQYHVFIRNVYCYNTYTKCNKFT